ncbi:hypothetical protein [Reichenbachiella sp. MSK19-1]|uniref:hypothetical protein n=1 Tax=Reichenbachiella sp. MSK19-1 TaxID=1897631 RepID=UPI000E6BE4D0|nr:hypothetical protein [Reichenbachiella sp. MSK19-1]RJE72989.1 hypothetical protein BGP76_03320 [Reichenbachiella sp. MSK19-1]
MDCIICDNIADEIGSHLIPASLIKSCVGNRYSEESYNIDSKTANVDVYFGRDNLKNKSTKQKQNHYTRDNVLCKTCEKKLADLESKFAREFLNKFRIEKYNNNFEIYYSKIGHEIFKPKKLTNEEILAYFYSIVYRFCKVYEIEDNYSYLDSNDLLVVKKFLKSFLYQDFQEDCLEDIQEFKILINFNKYSDKGKFIATSNELKDPHIFYFCEAIVILFTKKTDEKAEELFGEILNTIKQESTKIVVGPEMLYESMSDKIARILANDFITNAVNIITDLNKKPYELNLIEFNTLFSKYNDGIDTSALTKAFDELKKKYSS